MLFWRVKSNLKYSRLGTGMKGSGSWTIESLHGGTLLGARGNGFVMFWDWESGEIVRRVGVEAKNVFWSGTGSLVAITAEDSFYILRFDRDAYNAKVEEGAEITDEGVEEAFEVVTEVSEGVKTAKWVGDCFIYTTSNRLCYFVGSESYTISPFDTPLYVLGYIPSHNRVYLTDKDHHIYGYTLSLGVVEYQTYPCSTISFSPDLDAVYSDDAITIGAAISRRCPCWRCYGYLLLVCLSVRSV
jgi:coatomer subunit beta'